MISWLRLPFWVGWTPLVLDAVLGAFLCGLGAWVAIGLAAWPWRRLREGSWQEQARRAYPIRVACWVALLLPFASATLAYLDTGTLGPASRAPAGLVAAATAVAGLAAVVPQRLRAERRILGETLPMPGWWQLSLGRWLVIRPFLLVALAAVALMPARLGTGAFALLALTAFLLYRSTKGDGVRLACRLGLARPASPRLATIVRRAAERMERAPVVAYEWPALHALAFAFPSMPSLVVSDPALAALNDQELEAVAGHELGHLCEPRRVVAERSASVAWLLPLAAFRPLVGLMGWGPYLVFLLLFLLYGRFAVRRFRRLEQHADDVARTYEPAPRAYARALARLYEINRIPAVLPGRPPTHPHLHDRLVAAGAVPADPRPRPPSRVRGFVALVLAPALLMGWVILPGLRLAVRHPPPSTETGLLFSIALSGGDAEQFAALVRARREARSAR